MIDLGNSIRDSSASIDDDAVRADSLVIIDLMRRTTSHEPKLHNIRTIDFDSYHYKYESGREADCHILGFYPREVKFTVYLMDGTVRYSGFLEQLGNQTTSKIRLYFKRLSDLQLPILEQILQ